MSDEFSAKKINNNEPNPWDTTTQPKYQPPSGYTNGQPTTSNNDISDFGLPQSTYRPIFPIPPAPNSGFNSAPPTPGYIPTTAPYGAPPSEDEIYRRAKARVNNKIAFFNNLRSYITTNIVLWGIWAVILLTSGKVQSFWPIWITAFWGIAITLHFFNVFGWPQKLDFLNERDRHQMIEDEMRRMRR